MSARTNLRLRVIAGAIAAVFLCQEIAWAVPGGVGGPAAGAGATTFAPVPSALGINHFISNPAQLEIPFEAATLQEVHVGTNGRLLIHIQDAHANLSGQQSLAKVVEHFLAKYGIKTVLVEGADRDVTLDPVRKLAPLSEWKIIARRFLYEGIVSGEEYLNLTSEQPMKIRGVEYQDLYDDAVRAYASLVDRRKDILHYLYQAKVSIDRLKAKMYPQVLLDHEKIKAGSDPDLGGDFKAQLDGLFALADAAGADLAADYPQMARMKDLFAKEKALDFDRANREQAAVLSRVSPSVAKSFAEAARRLRSSQVSQYRLMQQLMGEASAQGLDPEAFPALADYAKYLESFLDLKMEALMAEQELLEDRVFEKLLPDDDARKVRAIDRFLGLLGNAYKLQMSSHDFKMFEFNEKDFPTESWLAFMNRKLADLGFFDSMVPTKPYLEEARADFGKFYRLVGQRDDAFVENANKIMTEEGTDAAILIAGGYHTDHLTELLRAEGTSYIVLTPLVNDKTDQAKYEKVLLDHLKSQERRLSAARSGQSTLSARTGTSAGSDTGLGRAENVAATKIPRGIRALSATARMANQPFDSRMSGFLNAHGVGADALGEVAKMAVRSAVPNRAEVDPELIARVREWVEAFSGSSGRITDQNVLDAADRMSSELYQIFLAGEKEDARSFLIAMDEHVAMMVRKIGAWGPGERWGVATILEAVAQIGQIDLLTRQMRNVPELTGAEEQLQRAREQIALALDDAVSGHRVKGREFIDKVKFSGEPFKERAPKHTFEPASPDMIGDMLDPALEAFIQVVSTNPANSRRLGFDPSDILPLALRPVDPQLSLQRAADQLPLSDNPFARALQEPANETEAAVSPPSLVPQQTTQTPFQKMLRRGRSVFLLLPILWILIAPLFIYEEVTRPGSTEHLFYPKIESVQLPKMGKHIEEVRTLEERSVTRTRRVDGGPASTVYWPGQLVATIDMKTGRVTFKSYDGEKEVGSDGFKSGEGQIAAGEAGKKYHVGTGEGGLSPAILFAEGSSEPNIIEGGVVAVPYKSDFFKKLFKGVDLRKMIKSGRLPIVKITADGTTHTFVGADICPTHFDVSAGMVDPKLQSKEMNDPALKFKREEAIRLLFGRPGTLIQVYDEKGAALIGEYSVDESREVSWGEKMTVLTRRQHVSWSVVEPFKAIFRWGVTTFSRPAVTEKKFDLLTWFSGFLVILFPVFIDRSKRQSKSAVPQASRMADQAQAGEPSLFRYGIPSWMTPAKKPKWSSILASVWGMNIKEMPIIRIAIAATGLLILLGMVPLWTASTVLVGLSAMHSAAKAVVRKKMPMNSWAAFAVKLTMAATGIAALSLLRGLTDMISGVDKLRSDSLVEKTSAITGISSLPTTFITLWISSDPAFSMIVAVGHTTFKYLLEVLQDFAEKILAARMADEGTVRSQREQDILTLMPSLWGQSNHYLSWMSVLGGGKPGVYGIIQEDGHQAMLAEVKVSAMNRMGLAYVASEDKWNDDPRGKTWRLCLFNVQNFRVALQGLLEDDGLARTIVSESFLADLRKAVQEPGNDALIGLVSTAVSQKDDIAHPSRGVVLGLALGYPPSAIAYFSKRTQGRLSVLLDEYFLTAGLSQEQVDWLRAEDVKNWIHASVPGMDVLNGFSFATVPGLGLAEMVVMLKKWREAIAEPFRVAAQNGMLGALNETQIADLMELAERKMTIRRPAARMSQYERPQVTAVMAQTVAAHALLREDLLEGHLVGTFLVGGVMYAVMLLPDEKTHIVELPNNRGFEALLEQMRTGQATDKANKAAVVAGGVAGDETSAHVSSTYVAAGLSAQSFADANADDLTDVQWMQRAGQALRTVFRYFGDLKRQQGELAPVHLSFSSVGAGVDAKIVKAINDLIKNFVKAGIYITFEEGAEGNSGIENAPVPSGLVNLRLANLTGSPQGVGLQKNQPALAIGAAGTELVDGEELLRTVALSAILMAAVARTGSGDLTEELTDAEVLRLSDAIQQLCRLLMAKRPSPDEMKKNICRFGGDFEALRQFAVQYRPTLEQALDIILMAATAAGESA